MPDFLIKPSPNENFYVHWSTVVDNFYDYGTRVDLEIHDEENMTADRFERADRYGTSSHVGTDRWDSKWDHQIHTNGGAVNRHDLREFCETWDEELDWDNPTTLAILARCDANFELDYEEIEMLLHEPLG